MVNTNSKKSLIIENEYIRREFVVEHKRLITVAVTNLLTGYRFAPADGSEEFCLCFSGFPKKVIECSGLKVEKINAYESEGLSKAEFIFKSVRIKGCDAVIKMLVTLGDGDFYMNKYITVEFAEAPQIRLESVSLDILKTDALLKKLQSPVQESCDISGFHMSLGQPVFLESFFMGCEFPMSVNTINDGCIRLKYYSGKDVSQIVRDNIYVSYGSVFGCAASDNEKTLTAAFYRYIDKISLPSAFRVQYNSWYDHMLDINDENLSHSFFEIEKGCTRFGLPPLDAYVADDGWNDYSADFWSFNEKFPNGFYKTVKNTHLLCSDFGLWLGPRGGYNPKTYGFAKRIEQAGKGHCNHRTRDICVASTLYAENTYKLLADYIDKYDISYLKLDGFAKKPCKNPYHGHLTGGRENIYFYTDLCEKWLDIFEKLRDLRKNKGGDLWLNITCYVNPSPWLLKWVNSVWIQNSSDMGLIDTADDGARLGGTDKDKLLTYRDSRYYDFYVTRKLVFPPRCLYNHEPVYGNTAKITMSGNDFLQYLIMNACRGTAFWELYYSYNMMDDEKWSYSAAVLKWAEQNRDILSRSVMIGNSPSSSCVYGYGCFKDANGIVALRNPSAKAVSYTLRFDESMGVNPSTASMPCADCLTGTLYGDISYASNMEIQLQPHEMKVLVFGGVSTLDIPKAPPTPQKTDIGCAIEGDMPFSIRAFIPTDGSKEIYAQGDELKLIIDDDNKITFTLGSLCIQSQTEYNDSALVTAVREANGMIKLYIDGELEASAYNGEVLELSYCEHPTACTGAALFIGALSYDAVL